jgi:hypothetical protein
MEEFEWYYNIALRTGFSCYDVDARPGHLTEKLYSIMRTAWRKQRGRFGNTTTIDEFIILGPEFPICDSKLCPNKVAQIMGINYKGYALIGSY